MHNRPVIDQTMPLGSADEPNEDSGGTIDGAGAFTRAAREVVEYLNRHTVLSDWSVSRVSGGEQVHVHVHHVDLIDTGDRVPWGDSFCHQMTLGAGHVVPDSALDPVYSCLPDSPAVRAYVGYPINDDDGSLFGVLCGVDAAPLPDVDAVDAELIELLSTLLSSHLATARAADRVHRVAHLSSALAETDALTGLMNRRGWDAIVVDAQQRIDAFGDLVAVAVIDLDGLKTLNDTEGHEAGDALLRRAAEALQAAAGSRDRVARYGGDEFVILTNNVAVADLPAHFERFAEALEDAGAAASIGHAFTGPGERTVAEAFRLADAQMYAAKRLRRAV